MAEISYRSLLQTNNYLRNLSDTTYWLCIARTVQESKLFPMNPYMLLSYLNPFYRLPTQLREIDAATPAVARLASATLTPGPASRSPSTNTISASIRGWMNLASGTAAPLEYTVDASTGP